ncbi:unnamed protein product [Echinostoma caproni]|uniref:SURF1-like protein n=1 Tax=Echinostoma caproni TaxID=27848 RepID=A0A183AB54_9TREM|nr:unnamed protein product [Echinostoma caproni]
MGPTNQIVKCIVVPSGQRRFQHPRNWEYQIGYGGSLVVDLCSRKNANDSRQSLESDGTPWFSVNLAAMSVLYVLLYG